MIWRWGTANKAQLTGTAWFGGQVFPVDGNRWAATAYDGLHVHRFSAFPSEGAAKHAVAIWLTARAARATMPT